jgi:hypothetical protein
MANEFKIKNGYLSEGNSQITGSLNVSAGITGSLQGTASYATQALSASYAPSTPTFPYTGSAIITGSLEVTGSVFVQDINGKTNIDSFDRKLYGAHHHFLQVHHPYYRLIGVVEH